ncbi:hypothetical protein [Brucella tritici]|nr:hypothetical protein [Brucella tritici]
MATRRGYGSSSIFVRNMAVDCWQASDQLEAQTRPTGAQNGQGQRLWTDQTRLGAMPLEQAGKRDAHGLRRRATGKAGVIRLVIMMGLKVATVSVQPPCLDRSKRSLQWPDLAEEQRDALRPL